MNGRDLLPHEGLRGGAERPPVPLTWGGWRAGSLVLRALGALDVLVVDGADAPVAGARVHAQGRQTRRDAEGLSDATGRVHLGGLPRAGGALRVRRARRRAPARHAARARPAARRGRAARAARRCASTRAGARRSWRGCPRAAKLVVHVAGWARDETRRSRCCAAAARPRRGAHRSARADDAARFVLSAPRPGEELVVLAATPPLQRHVRSSGP
ncbi:MAG: carboxypeptidase regulatory-like domain-containing protein [Planctomycetes bacterium]|nr:carboxypeptidase regulatory-like domain-containing protein [Planctomycetota bacterium]